MYSPHIVRYCHCLLFIFVPHWPAHREARSDSPQQRSPVSCSFTLTQDGDPGRDLAVSSESEREVGAAPCQCGASVTEKRSSSRHQHSAVCQNCRNENRAEDTGIFTPALASSSRLRQGVTARGQWSEPVPRLVQTQTSETPEPEPSRGIYSGSCKASSNHIYIYLSFPFFK